MSSPALSSFHSANLLQILRRANAHYSHIASLFRVSIHPTHHARKRAAALGLTVSIQKALNLDPKQISTIPLPVLDRVVTPHLSKAVVGRERELARVVRPVLKCTIPSYPRSGTPSFSPMSLYHCVPLTPDSPAKARRGQSLTSRWSMTPIDADSDVAQPLPEGLAITYNADNEDMVLCSPTEAGESVRFSVKPTPQLNLLPPPANDQRKVTRLLDIPVDITKPLSWVSGTDTSSPGSLSTESTSTTSSYGPATPVSVYLAESLHHFTQLPPDSTTQMEQRNS